MTRNEIRIATSLLIFGIAVAIVGIYTLSQTKKQTSTDFVKEWCESQGGKFREGYALTHKCDIPITEGVFTVNEETVEFGFKIIDPTSGVLEALKRKPENIMTRVYDTKWKPDPWVSIGTFHHVGGDYRK